MRMLEPVKVHLLDYLMSFDMYFQITQPVSTTMMYLNLLNVLLQFPAF